ncbi:MAG: MotA/TolQ/ExbB proton channel family protein, partial [Oscillospiraceae bacterium]|nr:MotA/TolQ/ExbB proton channel family protein [Oscillospiraceae bacterium]
MLRDLSDMAALGPAMAVALITTFYGSVLANIVFNPLSKRLKTIGTIEYTRKELVVEGMLAIENGENPRVIKEKLSSFLSRSEIDAKAQRAAKAAEDAMSKAEK